jgi:hypothetical protein
MINFNLWFVPFWKQLNDPMHIKILALTVLSTVRRSHGRYSLPFS